MFCFVDELSIAKEIIDDMWKEAFYARKRCWLKVMSNSMFPLLQAGDYVLLEYFDPSLINSGDIVTYIYKSRLLMSHRVIGKLINNENTYYIEKPDNSVFSSIIPQNLILGKITKIKRENRILELNRGIINIFNKALIFHSKLIFFLSKELLPKNIDGSFFSSMVLYFLNIASIIPGKVLNIFKRLYK